MRGSTTKKINNWCKLAWNSTPEEQRTGFRNFDHFVSRVKSQWKEDVKFKEWLEMTLQKGLMG